MKKRILYIALTALLALLLIGCTENTTEAQKTVQTPDSAATSQEDTQGEVQESAGATAYTAAQNFGKDKAEFIRVSLVRVVDGDTIIVNDGSSEQRVRLIGIDAAESVHPDESRNTQEGTAASDYLKSLLTEGQTLYLQKDVSDTDKYDRLLRYVWLDTPASPDYKTEAAEKLLNAIIVKDGYATVKDYPPDTKYSEILHSLEIG